MMLIVIFWQIFCFLQPNICNIFLCVRISVNVDLTNIRDHYYETNAARPMLINKTHALEKINYLWGICIFDYCQKVCRGLKLD